MKPFDRYALELLAPAKNLEQGMEAINHGADAVYIGGPAFGARAAAGNSIGEIEFLAEHAHRYNAKVLVAFNTILHDEELDEAQKLVWQIYEAGADALIVQDMGLLMLDLPPIQLHASTQTDIRSVEKVKFLQDVGFSQVVLARELSLKQIKKIAAETHVPLEFFIHGALCVAYSGQCYISHAHTGRSANRGECSQACRLPYDLADSSGQIVAQDKHLLSVKDNNQSDNIGDLALAGISSFKIEGRYKDMAYVKNVTAHYRQLLDTFMDEHPEYHRRSDGKCTFTFQPRPEKTFNRGTTDYFVNGRKEDIGAFDSPKFAGDSIGYVAQVAEKSFTVHANVTLHNGDGLSYYAPDGELVGLRINRVEAAANGEQRLFPSDMQLEQAAQHGQGLGKLRAGTEVFRNHDQEFVRLLEKKSAERRIAVSVTLEDTPDGLALHLDDEIGVLASVSIAVDKAPAQNADKAEANLREGLGKLGNTLFYAKEINLRLAQPWFIPASVLNNLRRQGVEALENARQAAWQRPPRAEPVDPPALYPESELSYLGNVLNHQARAFYTQHGVGLIESAYEANEQKGMVSLMITKHCLRYSFNLCPKQVKGIRPEPMTLIRGKEKLHLRFDCKPCEMHVVGKLKIARRKSA